MKPTRYGSLRPHRHSMLTWCVEGRPWADMIEILANAGCRVTPAAVQNTATRHGYTLLHPYSTHFDEHIRSEFLSGKISATDLPKIYAESIGQQKQSAKHHYTKIMKPILFGSTSEKGGTRKSRSVGLLYHALVESGLYPIVLALDTNNNLVTLLRGATHETWDINNADESRRKLELALQLAIETGQPIILDVPAKGGETLGIHTILRTGMLKYAAHVVGIVPTLPDEEYAHRAIGALTTIAPDAWIHIKYKSTELDYNAPAHGILASMNPAAIVTPPELTDEEANAVATLPVALSQLEEHVRESNMRALGCLPYLAYWEAVRPQLLAAIEAAAPGLLATASTAEPAVPDESAPEATTKGKAKSTAVA